MGDKRKYLPKNAKRVFRGVIFEVWQWKQKMFDGSFETFEKLIRPDTCLIIPTVGNKILVIKQKQPGWKKYKTSAVGGRVDEGEMPIETAKRELLEETGYVSKNWKCLKKIRYSDKIIASVHFYVARNCVYKQSAQPDAGEKIETRLITFDEFIKLSEDLDFYEGELKNMLLRARFDKKFKKDFHSLLFGKSSRK
jgi:ADP-ribose pyrophosphatase